MSELLSGEAALRRALQAAASQVDPGDDGLAKIKARVQHRRPMPFPLAWVDVALTKLSLRVPDGFWAVWDRLAREVRAVSRHFVPSTASHRARPDRAWLAWARPVAAMSTAVFIVAAVVYMAIEVPEVISVSPAGGNYQQNQGTHPRGGGGSAPGPQGSATPGSSGSGYSPAASGRPSSSACGRTSGPPQATIHGPSPSNTPTPTATTPTPTATTPTPTPTTPTPTPSDTTQPASGTGGSPSTNGGLAVFASTGTGAAMSNATTVHASTAGKTVAGKTSAPGAAGSANSRNSTASPSPTPCSSKATPKPTTTTHSGAAGQLELRTAGAGLEPADLRARMS